MKIAILGSTGMLGSAVTTHFKRQGYEVTETYRDEKFSKQGLVYFNAADSDFSILDGCEYAINCIGIIKPFMSKNISESIYINSIFPRKLANYCEEKNIKLLHITTDCVFSGRDGNYNENSVHDCLDDYGKSKSLGEPNNCMVIRTSIIGEEIHKNASLISWAKSMKGKEVNGYTNHLWNGVTTNRYAEICEQIIKENLFETELFHIHSNSINKFELLSLINEKFGLDLKINEFMDKIEINRTLTTIKNFQSKLSYKTIQQQIGEIL